MQTTTNFKLPLELAAAGYARATILNAALERIDEVLDEIQSQEALHVIVRNMVSDATGGGAPPAAVNGDAFVVNTWGAGNYVGAYVGAFANGDIAEYSEALAGFVRVLANVGTVPVMNIRVLVKAAGAAGSFTGWANRWAQYTGIWQSTAPADGDTALVIGEQTVWENETFVYDAVTAGWYSQGKFGIVITNCVFVDKSGNDTTGSGRIERPVLTIARGYALATAGQTIIVGPGVYTETLVFAKQVDCKALIPGTVTISGTVAAGAVVTVSGAAIGCTFDGINITNISAAGVAAVALLVNNAGATVTGPITFTNGTLRSGAGVSTAFQFAGNAGGGLQVDLYARQIQGLIRINIANAADRVLFNGVEFLGGAAAWCNITGNAAGQVLFITSYLGVAAAGEILNFGGAAACAVLVGMANFVMVGTLALDNLAGAGGITMLAGAEIGTINALQANQIIHRWLGEDEMAITMYNIDANGAPGALNMYAPAGARVLAPHTVRTMNRGAATGAILNYQFNGSGAGTVVPAVGVGALAPGIANEIVLQDVVANPNVLQFELLAASGVPGDALDAEVICRLF